MRFERVLVGIDFSSSSLASLEYARALVRDDGALWLFHVAEAATLLPHSLTTASMSDSVGTVGRLTELAEEARAHGVASAEIKVALGGRPADRILAASKALGVDAVVLGAHAGAVTRLFLGSVSEEVARRSAIPTLIVREFPVADTQPIRRVVVAVDHGEHSVATAKAAMNLASRVGAKLEAVHVVTHASAPPVHSLALEAPLYMPFYLDDACAIGAELSSALGPKTKVHFLAGAPAAAIVNCGQPGDVIVCGSPAPGRLARLLFGSVATRVLRRACCPVVLVGLDESVGAMSACTDELPRTRLGPA